MTRTGSEPHPACQSREQLLACCEVRRQRRSGPGGQHRNKVASGIFLRHLPTGMTSEATERRSQHDNLTRALFRLRINLAIHVRSAVRPAGPSRLWRERCHGLRLRVAGGHDDFPCLLAEAIDVLSDCEWDAHLAARRLCCTGTQLVKLLRQERHALQTVNRHRQATGRPSLS
jgi:hypothetical protein